MLHSKQQKLLNLISNSKMMVVPLDKTGTRIKIIRRYSWLGFFQQKKVLRVF